MGKVLSGLDVLPANLVKDKRLGLVTNQTGIDSCFRRTAEVLVEKGARIAAIFGPEHGYYGVEQDALPVGDQAHDPWTGAPVYSLYRQEDMGLGQDIAQFAPPPGSLEGVEALVFDIQDVGVRYYTYPTTLGILMEQVDLPLIVIDRPNPIGGVVVEGPNLEPGYSTFVGRYPVPVRHGLTIGELAGFINAKFLNNSARLQVIQMEGWRREMQFEETRLPWVLPSPNLPTPETARLYPGTCLLEGTNIAAGRGTTRPFELCGAPWIDPLNLAPELNGRKLPGLYFRETYFKPAFDRFMGQVCGGVQVHLIDPGTGQNTAMVRAGLEIVAAILRLYPHDFEWLPQHFDRLIGSAGPRKALTAGEGDPAVLVSIFEDWAQQENTFNRERHDFLLYR